MKMKVIDLDEKQERLIEVPFWQFFKAYILSEIVLLVMVFSFGFIVGALSLFV